jgi:transcriptional regulator with XRE-family HTH domain
MDLFDKIKDLCSTRDISISRLEQETQLANGSIKKWKHSYPSSDRLQKVAEYFGVSTDFLLGRTDNPDINPDEDIPFEAREELKTFIEFLKTKYKKGSV